MNINEKNHLKRKIESEIQLLIDETREADTREELADILERLANIYLGYDII